MPPGRPSAGPIRVLELRSVRGTGGGPEKTILNGAALADPSRFAVTVCYIRDQRDRTFALDALARTLGVDYVEVPERHSFDPSIFAAVRALIRERRIDIVHGHEYKTDLLALLLARTERVMLVATAHGWTGHSLRERAIYYPADRWLLARFPFVIAVSEQIRGTLIESGCRPERVRTVLNGIDPSAFRRDPARDRLVRTSLNIPTTSPVLGSVGRLEPQKRFDLLIEAFDAVRHDRPDAWLLIAGDGSQRAALTRLVETKGLGDRCLVLGHRTDVRDVLQAFDVFVQSSDYEGTPNVVLEAMALEVPVVATDAGGTAQILRHEVDGLVVPVGRPDLMAAAIESAIANPAVTSRRVDSARRRVEHELSFTARQRTVEHLLEELLDAREATAS